MSVRNAYNRWNIIEQLKKLKIENIAVVKPSVLTYKWKIEIDEITNTQVLSEQLVWLKNLSKPFLPYLELHVVDGCNLNCKGCLHFSNLYQQSEQPNLEETLRDIKRISECCEIFNLRILGGEPLLNKNLDSFIEKVRFILPHSDISVVTNEILVPKQDPDLFHIMRKNKVGFNITLYPPTYEMKEKIYEVLDKYEVSYGSHIDEVQQFSKELTLKRKKENILSHLTCVSKGCVFLREGRLYKCAKDALIGRFNDRFNLAYECNSSWDIYSNLNWENVINDLYEKPVTLCGYCSEDSELFGWKSTFNPKKEDWVIRNYNLL